ncbi:MAG: site-specific DNA-methyltransferase, partial [Hydrotalea sp.]|nr:site-specific DNA-methyltransferase [Hydrotalea sp.]
MFQPSLATNHRADQVGDMAEVACEDCHDLLPRIPEKSIDLVLTDPPYFIDGMGDDWQDDKLQVKVGRAGLVGSLPVGMKFDKQQGVKLYQFMLPVARQWWRAVKPGGFVLCFSQPRLAHKMATALEDAGFDIKDIYAWQRPGQAKAFSQEHFIRKNKNLSADEKIEVIKNLQGRKTPQLRPTMDLIVMAQKTKEGTFVDNWLQYKVGLIDVTAGLLERDKFPATIMPCAHDAVRYDHLTQKPVNLLRHLIRIFTAADKNTTILDCFAGTGSTAVAAAMEGRQFIACDREEKYAAIANLRLQE